LLTAGAFLALYERYEGSCMMPESYPALAAFAAVSSPFIFGFVWAVCELVRLLRPRSSLLFGICVGLIAYAAIAAGVWMADPRTALEDSPGADFRLVMSVDWSAGLLLEAGAFSDYSCGY
jgi:hypothetical protein